jgi:glutamine amidotransferase
MKKITIIDCGIGNRASIHNMLRQLGVDAQVSNDPLQILNSNIIILPGVGAFDAFIQALSEKNLINVLNEAVLKRRIPILGLCVGMQVLFEKSEEGELPGLSWIPGQVRLLKQLFDSTENIKLPHIGWKSVEVKEGTFIPKENQYYFVHSYYCGPQSQSDVLGSIEINQKKVVVAVQKDNIYGAQFHPEKSHRFGLEFFKNFIHHVSQ